MGSRHDSVTAEMELRLVVADGPDRAVHAELSYLPRDPYAVRIGFHTGTDDVVEWTFARSLLTDGVTHPVGDGDVQVWPSTGDAGVQQVRLSLSSPSGTALFEAPLAELVQFLTKTYALVPTGCESNFVDVGAELASLLGYE
ncbi:MAG TPA: SsgA family sporulation/cell division regulator [Mycobacteriales bacterium]|nr:SsgA family sporulation/cell division regulator [Mycobacteriales bacterium]